MNSRLFTTVAATSLLISAGTCALWASLYWHDSTPARFTALIGTLLAIAGSIAMPILWLGRHLDESRRRARLTRGRCPQCEYDLTANTTGVCPECGCIISRPEKT